jgi:hypothetical protein
MSVSAPGLFTQSVFSPAIKPTKQKEAAMGFAQIFTTMLAKQMRESMVGDDKGPMGIGGGATGDIYGAFIDQAMGKALAGSKSMNQLTKMINRELSGPRHPIDASSGEPGSIDKIAFVRDPRSAALVSTPETSGTLSPNYTGVTMPADKLGPILLPPTPSLTAPVLLPPPSEG